MENVLLQTVPRRLYSVGLVLIWYLGQNTPKCAWVKSQNTPKLGGTIHVQSLMHEA